MEEGEGSSISTPKRSRKATRKANAKRRIAEANEQEKKRIEEINSLKFGTLTLTPTHLSSKKHLTAFQRENGFFLFCDFDCLKTDLRLQPPSVTNTFRKKIIGVLKNRYGAHAHLRKAIGIGNMHGLFSIATEDNESTLLRETFGVDLIHVYPRDSFCASVSDEGKTCGQQLQRAIPNFRAHVPYEKNTDIADDKLEDKMYEIALMYGGPLKFVLMSGDGDFARPMEKLKNAGVEMYVVVPKIYNKRLLEAASSSDHVLHLKEVLDFDA